MQTMPNYYDFHYLDEYFPNLLVPDIKQESMNAICQFYNDAQWLQVKNPGGPLDNHRFGIKTPGF